MTFPHAVFWWLLAAVAVLGAVWGAHLLRLLIRRRSLERRADRRRRDIDP